MTRVYRWAGVARLGLVVQPTLPEAAHVRNADLSEAAFARAWATVPFRQRVLFSVGSACVGIALRVTGSRAFLARHLALDDLASRDDVFDAAGPHASVLSALMHARDVNRAKHLDAALHDAQDANIAVVYGAGHMPSLLRHLRDTHGYRPAHSTWLTVFGY